MRLAYKPILLFALRSSRPLLWAAVLLPYIGGAVLSHAPWNVSFWIVLIFLTWPYNFVLYGVNDYFDQETDAINVRKTETTFFAGLKPSLLLNRVGPRLVGLALGLVVPVLLFVPVVSSGLCIALIAAAIAYSVPPVRVKERPPFDSLLNGVLYFALPFVLGWSLSGTVQDVSWVKVLIISITAAGFHVLASSIDYTADVRAGVRTVATVIGIRPSLVLAGVCVSAGLLASSRYWALQIFLILTLVLVGVVWIRPSEVLARKMGYYIIYPGFIVATILCILQVLGKL